MWIFLSAHKSRPLVSPDFSSLVYLETIIGQMSETWLDGRHQNLQEGKAVDVRDLWPEEGSSGTEHLFTGHPLYKVFILWGWGGGWSQSQLTLGKRPGSPWTSHQHITRLTYRDKQAFTLVFIPHRTPDHSQAHMGRTCKPHSERPPRQAGNQTCEPSNWTAVDVLWV